MEADTIQTLKEIAAEMRSEVQKFNRIYRRATKNGLEKLPAKALKLAARAFVNAYDIEDVVFESTIKVEV